MPFKEDSSLLKRRVLAAIPCVIAFVAFACSYAGNFYCDNVQFAPDGSTYEDTDFFRPRPISFGVWMYKKQLITNRIDGQVIFTESCSGYERGTELDINWKIARIFSVVSIIVAGFILLWQFCAPFLLFDALYWRWAALIFAFVGVCQGLTLFFVMSEACLDNPFIDVLAANPDIYQNQCSWDWGSRVSFLSTILYFATVLSMAVIPAPGTRPNERKFPMMVWGSAEDEDDEESGLNYDSDDDSVESFACDDFVMDDDLKKGNGRPEMEATERSSTGYEDDDDDREITITEVINQARQAGL